MKSITEFFLQVVSPGMLKSLPPCRGFMIESHGIPVEFGPGKCEVIGPQQWRVEYHAENLSVQLEVELSEEFRWISWQVCLQVKNKPIEITRIHPLWLVLPHPGHHDIRVRTVTGGSAHALYPSPEYREFYTTLSYGHDVGYYLDSPPNGKSSHHFLPFIQVEFADGGMVGGLEWSGPWQCAIHYSPKDNPDKWPKSLFLSVPSNGIFETKPGPDTSPDSGGGMLRLPPGQKLMLPRAHLVFFEGRGDAGGNAFRRFLRHKHCPTHQGKPPVPPVSYDSWFGIFYNINEDILQRQARRAMELGLEYFIIDAGWYEGCNPEGGDSDFMGGMGNWEHVDLVNFPNGLEPIAGYVKKLGLKLGMFFELARCGRKSRWAKEHPYLFLDPGTPYLYLNLTLPEAQQLVVQTMDRWIRTLDVHWLRWEMGTGPCANWPEMQEDPTFMFRYEAGLHATLDLLRQRYPHLLIELCCEGGNRLDLATLKRGHTSWLSDACEDPLTQRTMQCGANRFLPGNFLNGAVAMGSWIGPGDTLTSDAAVVSRMCGALSFGGDIASLSPERTVRVAQLVSLYKSFRHLLVEDFYPLTPQPQRPEDGEAVLFVSYDKKEAVLLAFSGVDAPAKEIKHLHLRGLGGDAIYAVTDALKETILPPMTGKQLLENGLHLNLQGGVALFRLISAPGVIADHFRASGHLC